MSFTVKKLAPNIGAEVIGLDIAKGIDAETAKKLSDTLEENFVVLLRNQKITPEQQVEYARAYGSPESLSGYGGSGVDAAITGLPPEVFQITNDPDNPTSESLKGAARWHTDLTWSNLPSKAAVLHAQNLPSDGAGTKWCALYPAFESLPAERQAQLLKMRAVHSVEAAQLRDHPDASEEDLANWRRVPPVEHPLVWSHADGRKSLVLGPTIDHIVGLSREDSEALREELEAWCIQPEFVYEHTWTVGDLLIWFNSATMHHAVEYTGRELRLLHRITITGEEEIR